MNITEEEVLDGLFTLLLRSCEGKPTRSDNGMRTSLEVLQKKHDVLVDRCDDLIAFILSTHEPNGLPEVYNAISDHVNEGDLNDPQS